MSVSVEQRIIIKFLTAERIQPSEILQRLEKQFGVSCLSNTLEFEWCKTFREERERERERERAENRPHKCRPWTSITPSNIDSANVFDFLQERRTIIAEYYSNTVLGEIKNKIRSKRKTGGHRISFLQDNARLRTVRKPMEIIRKLKWASFHPPYSPDIATSDFFFLFWRLKSDLEGVRFEDNQPVISYIQEWIRTQPKKFLKKRNKTVAKTQEKMYRSQ